MNYNYYGGQLSTPKLSLTDAGGGPSSDYFCAFSSCGFPNTHKKKITK